MADEDERKEEKELDKAELKRERKDEHAERKYEAEIERAERKEEREEERADADKLLVSAIAAAKWARWTGPNPETRAGKVPPSTQPGRGVMGLFSSMDRVNALTTYTSWTYFNPPGGRFQGFPGKYDPPPVFFCCTAAKIVL